jgi:hypothetical protein
LKFPKGKTIRKKSYQDAHLIDDMATGRYVFGAIHLVSRKKSLVLNETEPL